MSSDLTFITNEPGKTLKERFGALIQHARFFDALVGYFFTSGFYAIYPALEKTEKARILIGISTNRQTYDLMSEARQAPQLEMVFSHAETKLAVEQEVAKEMEESPDTRQVEQGVFKFIEWLRSGKLEIKVYPSQNIHAKVYILTFPEGFMDVGRVITGSSNLTQAGLVDNLEFNVELKNSADHILPKKFENCGKTR
jgi:phosphatidylserine/phosphatidylglycerophosphate/cardiolipin synthase-like enzyme